MVYFSIFLPRDEIDNPHKKRAQKVFRENFSIELFFESATTINKVPSTNGR